MNKKKAEPKEGDERLGVITDIDLTYPWYWRLEVPSLQDLYDPDEDDPPSRGQGFIPNPGGKARDCPVHTQQICMFRYSRWRNPSSGVLEEDLYWQPVLDYFETNRQEQ